MKFDHLRDNGWFVGSFESAAYFTDLAEVCYRKEPIGPHRSHFHTKCTEIILLVRGQAQVRGKILTSGDIVILNPGEINDIVYLEETEVVCVKTPAGGNDKVSI